MTPPPRHPAGRAFGPVILAAGLPLLLLAGCVDTANMDWDLRSGAAGYDTSAAARQATTARPTPDARGVISYPNYQVVVARRDDTVATVATRVGLAPQELASYNALQPTDPLRAGEVLALPRRVAAAAPVAAAIPGTLSVAPLDVGTIATTALDRVDSAAPAAAPAPAAGPEPLRHKVKRGETAYTIARLYDVSPKALAEWNGLGPDLAVREGQYLIIPTAVPGAAPPPATAVATAPGTGSPTPEPPSASQPLPDQKVAPAASTPAAAAKAAPNLGSDRTAASAPAFAMPVSGTIVGAYAKGRNDGIDIQAPAGTAVKAAASGSVAAVTKDTDGTPIAVIRHADGLLTVYAGVQGLKVAKGDSVSKGQTIGTIGSSPLHFEVRKGIDSVDPMPYLQ